jgi:uncharacterized protein
MSYSLYQSCVPVFTHELNAFLAILDKAQTYAETMKFDPGVYMTLRLRPDMFPFPRQVQTFCDNAKNAPSRVAGVEAPRFEDNETTFDELRSRIGRTLDVIAAIDPKAVDAGAEREIVFPAGRNIKAKMLGGAYVAHYVMPNFFFHLVTAYDILRYAGAPIGKRDYLGAVPGLTVV